MNGADTACFSRQSDEQPHANAYSGEQKQEEV